LSPSTSQAFFLVFELRALYLQVLCHLSHAPSPFSFIFETGSHIYAQASLGTRVSYLNFQHRWDNRCVPPCPAFHSLRWGSLCPGWPGTTILLISTSHIAGITGVTHCIQLFSFFVGPGFELRALYLQSRCFTWATTPVHFALVILEMGSWEIFA
jgi:hypothetical protein